MPGKTLEQFEAKHGGGRIKALQGALDTVARTGRRIDLEIPTEDNSIRFGLIGDTQMGSLYEAHDELESIYALYRKLGITDVLHTGDVLDGFGNYKGQIFEQHRSGFDQQTAWFAEKYPQIKGIRTHFITGNHDTSFTKLVDVNVGTTLVSLRPDCSFLGEDTGRVRFVTKSGRAYDVMLLHPGGGTAYALSYRPQKTVEQLEGGTKPQMLALGHYHKAEFIPSYRNISVIQSGCFQWQTPFMLRLGIAAHVGGWVIEVTPGKGKDLWNNIQARFVAFYRPE